MSIPIPLREDWALWMHTEMEKPYYQKLMAFLENEYTGERCFPPSPLIFNALNACAPEEVRVVIIGQDPYHGEGEANGLSFSVPQGVKIPPSLRNIFRELEQDLGIPVPSHGDLSHWALQGVLLLNAILSVREGKPGSHKNMGWETFTDAIISKLSARRDGLIFMLWGAHAQKKQRLIDLNRHVVLLSGHPSPLSANQGKWFGNRHFSKANTILSSNGQQPILW